jgi:hypothetical protein
MADLPDKSAQIVQAHAALIYRVVMACLNRDRLVELEPVLNAAAEHGWIALVAVIRGILAGRRDPGVMAGLDEEDTVIAQAILRGIQNPATVPDSNIKPDPTLAAPGLASMIHAATGGDPGALQAIAAMAEQMSGVGGDMGRLAGAIRPLINGERNPDILCKGMSVHGTKLMLLILDELARLEPH